MVFTYLHECEHPSTVEPLKCAHLFFAQVAVVLTLLATAGHTTEPEKVSKDHIAGVEYESAQAQRNKTTVDSVNKSKPPATRKNH
jgi:hypothetical protein